MHNILVIQSSINHTQGHSSQLSDALAKRISEKQASTLTTVSLSQDDLPHLSQEEMQAWMTPSEERTQAQQALAAISDGYVSQVQQADTIVIGMPMYNFGVPSAFKAWVDRIARAGITFAYTEEGPKGLLKGTKVIIVAARGGFYEGTALDTQTTYLRDFFAFLGLNDVEFIYAEGLATPKKDESLAAALTQIAQV